jgi:hypothetical protein
MNQLVKKEIRLLLPAWIAAMLLATFSPWILPDGVDPRGGLIRLLFPMAVLILGITSFGQEFNAGGMPTLLGLPIDRQRIWKTKTSILALGYLIVCCFGCASFLCRLAGPGGVAPFSNVTSVEFGLATFELIALSTLVTFSGGLWTTLLLRQATGAFWVTLLIPLVVMGSTEILVGMWVVSEWILNMAVITALTAYSIAGFFFARWLFIHAQDTQWAAGNISFAWRAGAVPGAGSQVSRTGNWVSALYLKEIHVHQVNVFIAGMLLVFQLSCLAALKVYSHFSNDTIFALKSVWIISLLMPLLIGSSAIAEERRLGVLEGQLSLPASRMAQWFTKLSVTVLLSLLIGGLVPFALVRMAGTEYERMPVSMFVIYPIVMSLVSSYASSLVRSTLLAIGAAMATVAVLWAAGAAIVLWNFGRLFPGYYDNYDNGQFGGIVVVTLFLGAPVFLAVISMLTYSNFKWLHEEIRVWRRNITVVFGVVISICILTNAIYFRAWEFGMPDVPEPGPARLDRAPELNYGSFNAIFAIRPDGKVWSDRLAYQDVTNLWWQTTVLVPQNKSSCCISGSNWLDVAVDRLQLLGIQSNGTLWSLQRRWNPSRDWWQQSGSFTLAQIGSDTDWARVGGSYNNFMILKRDGSLWRWGTNDYDWKHQAISIPRKLELDRKMMPWRVDAETNWIDLVSPHGIAYAKKRDGSLWKSGVVPLSDVNTNGPWSSIALYENGSFAEVKTNGELWFFETVFGSPATESGARLVSIRLGKGAKWRLCGNVSWDDIWAIRDDGTLWKWPPIWSLRNDPRENPVQLGSRSDWLALSDAWQFGISLAADGGVWSWGQPSRHIWLAPSRKPIYLGNIFEETAAVGQPAAEIDRHDNTH